ncbi:MAG: formylglycine-generating enzyme family protein, partial [bacterium]|nr:formylglycine-generating enzyme family protein [Candidatus Minthenecus merdequi]
KSQGYEYSGSNNIDDVAWYLDNSSEQTHPVGTKKANELGLYDMSGNVYEWCADWYGDYSSSSQTDPTGPETGSSRVLRGGSWRGNASGCRSTNRISGYPDYRFNHYGFRLVLLF